MRTCGVCGTEFLARMWTHKFCSNRCKAAARRRRLDVPLAPVPYNLPLEQRLMAHRILVEQTGCWEYDGTPSMTYGQTMWKRRRISIHRAAAELWLGLEPGSQLWVLHKCDNPRCFNPEHLYLGGPLENARDRKERGRYPIGEANKTARLNEHAVILIRELHSSGYSIRRLSLAFGVSQLTIKAVITGKTWAHIPLKEAAI